MLIGHFLEAARRQAERNFSDDALKACSTTTGQAMFANWRIAWNGPAPYHGPTMHIADLPSASMQKRDNPVNGDSGNSNFPLAELEKHAILHALLF